MSRKVLPLTGYKSLRALNAFHALLLGLKMLPVYLGTDYESFYSSFSEKSESEKEKLLKEAAVFVQLAEDEVSALISFCTDKNGVPYSATNLKSLGAGEIHEIIVAVCMEIGRIKIEIVTEEEKKKIGKFSIDVRRQYLKHPGLPLVELLNLAYLEAIQGVY